MKIIRIIKEWITKVIVNKNVKQLSANTELNYNDNTFDKAQITNDFNKTASLIETEKELDSIAVLKRIGCDKEIFYKIDTNLIDTQNLINQIRILNQFNFTKLELSKIYNENPSVMLENPNDISNKISVLKETFKDSFWIKKIIYDNPLTLTNEIDLNSIHKIFIENGIETNVERYLFIENPNILSLSPDIINNSLNLIKQVCDSLPKFKEVIKYMPELIGIEQIDLINEYINV